jgi:N-acetylglutamate synthase-like GNAT family acetyltransferase
MIRKATKYDKTQIVEMIRLFRDESKIEQYKNFNNVEYVNKLLDSILAGQGIIYIEDNVGLIIGVIIPTIWCDKTLALHELAWYVKPEHRNTTVGYRLLKAYVEYGKQLKEQDRIKMFTITKMVTSPDIKYGKFGFTKLDENWVQ